MENTPTFKSRMNTCIYFTIRVITLYKPMIWVMGKAFHTNLAIALKKSSEFNEHFNGSSYFMSQTLPCQPNRPNWEGIYGL